MLKPYGYLGLLLIAFAEINFIVVAQPFAMWYIPIVWYGYILFVDSLVYRVKKKSLLSSYPKEFLFMVLLSVPFWLIFEIYNTYTGSWIYTNYTWQIHIIDFTTIMPAVLETFMLINVLGIGRRLDKARAEITKPGGHLIRTPLGRVAFSALAFFGALSSLLPALVPYLGFSFMWFGIFLFLDPISAMLGRPSIIHKTSAGRKSLIPQLFLSGIIMGFFWEFWNFQAYPKWAYNVPIFMSNVKLFAMPVFGYLGYLPFALEVFIFYAFFRSFLFKEGNSLLGI